MSNLAGDIDMNKTVELQDLQSVLGYYGESVASNEDINPDADIDNNGILELKDLQAVLGSYGESVKTEVFAAAQ